MNDPFQNLLLWRRGSIAGQLRVDRDVAERIRAVLDRVDEASR